MKPVRFLRYPGGKQRIAPRLAAFIPPGIWEYREPFVGGGGLFLHLKQNNERQIRQWWINDLYGDLIRLWRCMRSPVDTAHLMTECMKLTRLPHTEQRKLASAYRTLSEHGTDLSPEMFYFLNRVTFSGSITAGGFSKQAAAKRFTPSLILQLEKLRYLLHDVGITDYSYHPLLEQPGKNVFIYCDPPYVKAKKLYGPKGSLHTFDHTELSRCLQESKHRWMLSYDDTDIIRDLYAWANIYTLDRVPYGMSKHNKHVTELVITNYKLPASDSVSNF